MHRDSKPAGPARASSGPTGPADRSGHAGLSGLWKKSQVALVVAALGAALLTWYVYARPVPQRDAVGVVTGKTFVAAHTETHYSGGSYKQGRTTYRVQVQDAYRVSVKLPDRGLEGAVSVDTFSAREFGPGDRVQVTFEERGIPPLWTQLIIKGIYPEQP